MNSVSISLLPALSDAIRTVGRFGWFLATVGRYMLKPWQQWRVTLEQLQFAGARSVTVIAVAGAFVGMVVALQFYDTLVRFGSVSLLGAAVGLSLIRELAPVLTALIVIGRVGSAMCAELGIMRTDNQIDALECMAIDPYAYLLMPRYLAILIAVPLLTAIFNVASGTTRRSSKNSSTPRPSQSGHAPNGALKEKSRGSISGMVKPLTGQAKFSEKVIRSGSPSLGAVSRMAIPSAKSKAVRKLSANRVSNPS